jgi:hypothetical protein
VVENGHVALPGGPGLGIELDDAKVEVERLRWPVGLSALCAQLNGSFAEW